MDTKIIRTGSFAVALILSCAAWAHPSKRWEPGYTTFVYESHPDAPIARFIAGNIGIPEPDNQPIYLFAAYRYLEGKPLSPEEQKRWLKVWKIRYEDRFPEWTGDLVWIKARTRLPVPLARERFRPAAIPQRFYTASSVCNEDSFASAAGVLDERARLYGIASQEMKFWVAGQDAVFEACVTAGAQEIPTAPAGAPPLQRADREYQIAAAALYSQRFTEAAAAFRRIAADADSPWSKWAPYQAGRAVLYEARRTEDYKAYNRLLAEAENQFRAVLSNPSLKETHPAAEYLLLRCLLVTNNKTAMERISVRLVRGDWTESDLSLYVDAFKQFRPTGWRYHPGPFSFNYGPQDALTFWIRIFQSGNADAATLAKRNSPAYLYASLWYADASAPDTLHQLALANGSLPLRFAAARQLARKGRPQEARLLLNRIGAELVGYPSARNRALSLRAQLSASWAEFFLRAPRTPVLYRSFDDQDEWPSPNAEDWRTINELPAESRPEGRRQLLANAAQEAASLAAPLWDEMAVTVLNEQAPLRILRTAATSSSLPPRLRKDLALTVFTRAAVLKRWKDASAVAPNLPSPAMTKFLRAPSEFAAAIVLLDYPGARPFVRLGFGRGLPPKEYHDMGRNWWWSVNASKFYSNERDEFALYEHPPAIHGPLPFVSIEQEREAEFEWDELGRTARVGYLWIAEKIVAEVEANPNRPDAAELLFRVVHGGRGHMFLDILPRLARRPNGVSSAIRLLATRYRATKWYQELKAMEPGEAGLRIE